ncbi:MAG: hypothetical protein QOF51_1665, partial [Chloroflexota bacterium]|nr:hypothetical protein [Chloroflexota bacterium]
MPEATKGRGSVVDGPAPVQDGVKLLEGGVLGLVTGVRPHV